MVVITVHRFFLGYLLFTALIILRMAPSLGCTAFTFFYTFTIYISCFFRLYKKTVKISLYLVSVKQTENYLENLTTAKQNKMLLLVTYFIIVLLRHFNVSSAWPTAYQNEQFILLTEVKNEEA
jgi:hypothetical protein